MDQKIKLITIWRYLVYMVNLSEVTWQMGYQFVGYTATMSDMFRLDGTTLYLFASYTA